MRMTHKWMALALLLMGHPALALAEMCTTLCSWDFYENGATPADVQTQITAGAEVNARDEYGSTPASSRGKAWRA